MGRHTKKGQPRHLDQRARQGENERDNHADDSEDNRASSVVCNGVHGDGEGQKMTGHDEDEEDNLSTTDEFPTPFPSNHFAGICHC